MPAMIGAYSDEHAHSMEHRAAYHAYQMLHFGFFLANGVCHERLLGEKLNKDRFQKPRQNRWDFWWKERICPATDLPTQAPDVHPGAL